MKKVAILLFGMLMPLLVSAQLKTTYALGTDFGSDSIQWTRIEGTSPVFVYWDFTDLDADDGQLWVYYGDEDESSPGTITPISVEKSSTVNRRYPLTLDKTNPLYMNLNNDGNDTINVVGVKKNHWECDYIGFKITFNSVTSGNFIQYIER